LANLTETPTFDAAVYELAITDPVQGGPGGVDNQPHQNLANRAAFLKAALDAVVVAGGLTPDNITVSRLRAAIDAMIGSGVNSKIIVWQPIKTAAYTANGGQGVPFDNTAAPTNLTLPAAPVYGDEVWFHDVAGIFKTNPLTVMRNNHLLMGLTQDSLVSTNNIRAGVKFYGTTIGWRFFV